MKAVPLDRDMMRRRMAGDPTVPTNAEVSTWLASNFAVGYHAHIIDVGASDGIFINSTYLLEKELRWTVLSVDANPVYKPLLTRSRVFVEICAVAAEPREEAEFHVNLDNYEAFSALNPCTDHPRFKEEAGERWETIKVPVRTLNQLLAKWEFPKLDILCVDVEGGESDVLKGLDWEKWKPKVVLLEAWEEGGHDQQMTDLGYQRVWRSAANDGYIRRGG